jgi:putative transposase
VDEKGSEPSPSVPDIGQYGSVFLKTELVHRTQFRTRREAKAALFEYIEIFYNRRRRHSGIDYRTPAQAHAEMLVKAAA